jgi:hypothetical protein
MPVGTLTLNGLEEHGDEMDPMQEEASKLAPQTARNKKTKQKREVRCLFVGVGLIPQALSRYDEAPI